ncbi:hypothetical protein ACFWNQ_24825 [Streptomyces virginiae]|uniref:hypothetical protein n=1 Tax=Streptomyces virginiae TaxID=1961 RepID=UPI0036676693
MNTNRVNAAAGVLHAAMQQGKSLPQSLAYGLEAAGLLQSPESAAELDRLSRLAESLHQRVDHQREGKARWRARAELAEARVTELEAERGAVVADRDAQIIAWLGKKAREYGTSNRESRDKAEAVGRMADKLSRGAVRRPHEDGYVSPLHQDHTISHDLPEVSGG